MRVSAISRHRFRAFYHKQTQYGTDTLMLNLTDIDISKCYIDVFTFFAYNGINIPPRYFVLKGNHGIFVDTRKQSTLTNPLRKYPFQTRACTQTLLM